MQQKNEYTPKEVYELIEEYCSSSDEGIDETNNAIDDGNVVPEVEKAQTKATLNEALENAKGVFDHLVKKNYYDTRKNENWKKNKKALEKIKPIYYALVEMLKSPKDDDYGGKGVKVNEDLLNCLNGLFKTIITPLLDSAVINLNKSKVDLTPKQQQHIETRKQKKRDEINAWKRKFKVDENELMNLGIALKFPSNLVNVNNFRGKLLDSVKKTSEILPEEASRTSDDTESSSSPRSDPFLSTSPDSELPDSCPPAEDKIDNPQRPLRSELGYHPLLQPIAKPPNSNWNRFKSGVKSPEVRMIVGALLIAGACFVVFGPAGIPDALLLLKRIIGAIVGTIGLVALGSGAYGLWKKRKEANREHALLGTKTADSDSNSVKEVSPESSTIIPPCL